MVSVSVSRRRRDVDLLLDLVPAQLAARGRAVWLFRLVMSLLWKSVQRYHFIVSRDAMACNSIEPPETTNVEIVEAGAGAGRTITYTDPPTSCNSSSRALQGPRKRH